MQRLVSQAYKVGTNEVKKSLYSISSDNKITRIEKQRNGIATTNFQYEYLEEMVGLKKARLNKGNTNTLFDSYSEEEFEYDLAGNPYRYKSGTTNWNTVSSSKNNQTTQINYASDAILPIRGKASTSATLNISVDGALQNYTRPTDQEEFAIGLNAYSTTKKCHEIKVEAVETDNNTTPPTTIRTMQRGKVYVEATPESFTYDANGNLLSDGRWNYTWDAENRLIEVETNLSAASAGVPQEKHVYVYDWTGRKIKAERYEYKDNAWMLVSTNKRYYDDYNLIYETTEYADGSSTEVRKYYYGTDLLGSVYGSAGTGGLRMMCINGEDLFVFNDQVGSVEALYGADADSASAVRAEYVYSAYGEVMMKSGDLADKNNITYSTRYKEANTGLVSYTYRHYAPRLKKWINKDPIAENGGINLYQMTANDPISSWDKLGMAFACSIDIYFGHGSRYLSDPVSNSINKSAKDANDNSISSSGYAVGGTSCHDSITNLLAGKYGYINPLRSMEERTSYDKSYSSWLSSLEIEIMTARIHARLNMCKKPPECCKTIYIFINVLMTDWLTADFYNIHKNKLTSQKIECL